MRLPVSLVVLLWLAACGGSRYAEKPGAAPAASVSAIPSQGAQSDRAFRPANMLWWQGAEPVCGVGRLKRRTLSWGGVYWCAVPGQDVDANLQNDLGRLARCLNESVSAFQQEPEPGKLGEFLARAHEAGLNPVLCSAVRRDSEPRTYNGRAILFERLEASAEDLAATEMRVRYRLSCEECLVASETTVLVAL